MYQWDHDCNKSNIPTDTSVATLVLRGLLRMSDILPYQYSINQSKSLSSCLEILSLSMKWIFCWFAVFFNLNFTHSLNLLNGDRWMEPLHPIYEYTYKSLHIGCKWKSPRNFKNILVINWMEPFHPIYEYTYKPFKFNCKGKSPRNFKIFLWSLNGSNSYKHDWIEF